MQRIQVKLRMTPEMKRELENAANDKGVSFNAEVMQRLSASRKPFDKSTLKGGDQYLGEAA